MVAKITEKPQEPVKPITERVLVEKVQPGQLMLLPYWVRVEQVLARNDRMKSVEHGTVLEVRNLDDDPNESPFIIEGKELVEGCFSADQYHEEVTIARTEIVEILKTAYNVPFTVEFLKKQEKPKKGEEAKPREVRTLRGRLIGCTPLAYVQVEDLDNPKEDRFRVVDSRSIIYLILRGVKYCASSKAE